MPFFYRYASWDIICSFALLWFNLGFALFAQTRVFLTWVFVFWVHDWDSHHSLNLLCQVFYEDLGMIFSFFMLVNLWAIFYDVLVMLCLMLELFASYRVSVSRYFAALCEFNIRTIVTLEKWLVAGSFDGFIDHLACR